MIGRVVGFVKPSRGKLDFVFLEISNGPDVFLPGQVMRAYGGFYPAGAMVEAEVIYSPDKGFRATQVFKVTQPHELRSQAWEPATVKWYDNTKGYGFCALDSGMDAFIPAKVLRACGVSLSNHCDGQRVEVQASPGARGGKLVVNALRFMGTT